MDTLTDFHLGIQYAARRLTNPDLTFESLGQELGISKQAVEKSCKKAMAYLKAYRPAATAEPKPAQCAECIKKDNIIAILRRQLILAGVVADSLKFFNEQVLKYFPKFKVARLPALEKKKVLDWLEKFRRADGLLKDFAIHIGGGGLEQYNFQRIGADRATISNGLDTTSRA